MKAVILAGGYGTRISEESHLIPKPMIEIGGKPILWHIMKIYSTYKIDDFIICLGYKGEKIKEYFGQFDSELWNIQLIDTGVDTMTGGRLKRISKYVEEDEFFCMTYGDGLSDINISDLVEFHKEKNVLATLTATIAPNRFGVLDLSEGMVNSFIEKPSIDQAKINGGFFVLSPKVLDYIEDDSTVWEQEPLEDLAKGKQLAAFEHKGFWQPMDTLRDKNYLQSLWITKKAPWKVW